MSNCTICEENINSHTYNELKLCNYLYSKIIKKHIDFYNNQFLHDIEDMKKNFYNKKINKIFKCDKCGKEIKNKRNYDIHIKENICTRIKVKKIPEFKCKKCERKFTDKRSLIYHNEHSVCSKKIKDLIAKQIKEPVQEPIKEPVQEPIQEPINIQIQELINKLINKLNNEPIQEPINKLNNEPIQEPINIQIQELINKLNNEPTNEQNQELINKLNKKLDQNNKTSKKTKISVTLKRKVWHKWIGIQIGQTKCLCCKITDIEQFNFSCGHVIPESKGGTLDVENLRPICTSCNSSMGNENMFEFMRRNKL